MGFSSQLNKCTDMELDKDVTKELWKSIDGVIFSNVFCGIDQKVGIRVFDVVSNNTRRKVYNTIVDSVYNEVTEFIYYETWL